MSLIWQYVPFKWSFLLHSHIVTCHTWSYFDITGLKLFWFLHMSDLSTFSLFSESLMCMAKCSHLCCSQTLNLIFPIWMWLLSVLIWTNWIARISLWLSDYSLLPCEPTPPCAANVQAPGGAAGHGGGEGGSYFLLGLFEGTADVNSPSAAGALGY